MAQPRKYGSCVAVRFRHFNMFLCHRPEGSWMVEVAERIGNQGRVIGWTKGSSFRESRQKRGTAECPRSPRGLGRLRRANWIQREPFPSSKQRGAAVVNNNFSLATSALDAASCPLDPIRHEQGTKSVRNRFRRISLTIQRKFASDSKTLKVLKPNPSIKLPLALKLVYRNRHPIHWPCSIMLELCHWNLTLCSMHQSFAGVTEAAAACFSRFLLCPGVQIFL